jgi:competence protein ComEC
VKSTIPDQLSISPLVWIAAAFLAGILLASFLVLPWLTWLQLAFLSLLLGLGLWRLRARWHIGLLVLPAVFFLGAARYEMVRPVITPEVVSYYNANENSMYVTGTIAEPPDVRDTSIFLRLRVSAIDLGDGDIPVQGDVLVTLTNEYEVKYGDHARVRGFLRTPSENDEFSYRDYLARQGILSTLQTSKITILPGTEIEPFQGLMYRVHDSLLESIYMLFPEPEASLLAGILLGSDKAIPAEVKQAFVNTGTAHIIAISGFNIAIVAAIFVALFSRVLGKKWGSLLAILGIILYTFLTGASASVVRAAIMGSMSVIAAQFGRRNLATTALATAALFMAVFNPLVLWDIGFQLSFAATLGLVFYAQPMQDAVSRFLSRYLSAENVEKFIGPFTSYVLLTFAAQLTTLPVSIYHFGRISLVSLIANPIVLPAQPAAMVLSGLAVVLSKLYMPLGQIVAALAWPFAAYTIRMVEFFNNFPGSTLILGEFSLMAAVMFYVVLFSTTLAWPKVQTVATPTLLATALAVLAFLTWRAALNTPDGRLHVLFLDVGSADSVLVTTPSGRNVLINGGESPSTLVNQLGRRIPPFSRGLEMLVVASTQENQVAALPRTLEQYRPKSVLWAGNIQASFSSKRLKEYLTGALIPVEFAEAGQEINLGDDVILRVLAVSARGAILSLEMGNFKTILPVGVNFDVFEELKNGEGLGPVTGVLIAESGYGPANPPAWLKNLNPQVAILSVSANNPDGLPSKEVMTFFEKATLLRTDQLGWVELASNGQQLWITTERKYSAESSK